MNRQSYHLGPLYCECCGGCDGETNKQRRMRQDKETRITWAIEELHPEIVEMTDHLVYDVRPTRRGIFCQWCSTARGPIKYYDAFTGVYKGWNIYVG